MLYRAPGALSRAAELLAVAHDYLDPLTSQGVARARPVRTMPGWRASAVVEVPWPRQRVVGYGVGPKKMSEHFCYLAAHNDHVNLGFKYGAALPDPEGLLEGPGKLMRHVKVGAAVEI